VSPQPSPSVCACSLFAGRMVVHSDSPRVSIYRPAAELATPPARPPASLVDPDMESMPSRNWSVSRRLAPSAGETSRPRKR